MAEHIIDKFEYGSNIYKFQDNVSGYVTATGAATAAPVQSVNGQTGTVVLDADDVGALPDDTTYVGSVSVTQNLSSGTKIGSINVDGSSIDLYAPSDTDTKVTQTATTTTDYTYWRGLCIGQSAVQAEATGFSTVTDQVRTFNNLRVQPSTGTLKATIFSGQLSGTIASSTTATTQANTDNSTKVATTAFVKSVLPTVPNNSNWVNGSATGSVRTINASTTIGAGAVAEGADSEASGDYSHAEGGSTAGGDFSHAEGEYAEATGEAAHAEGNSTAASGTASHAEGNGTVASGNGSHAEGFSTTASQIDAHAEGGNTTASGSYSHAEGYYTTANHKSQHVFGEYNVLDTSTDPSDFRGTYVEIVGKGTSTSSRSNARTLDWNGNETLAGKLTLGAAPTANMDAATKQYVDNAMTVVTLNGATTSNASFYAPTTAGTSGYYLKSNGSGAPTWAAITAGVSDVKINNTSIVSSGTANIVTNTAYNASTNKVATMTDINNAMTVVTFTPDGTNRNLMISVQQSSSIQNGNEVSY